MSGYIDAPSANFQTPFLVANVVSYPLADKPGNGNVRIFDLTYVVNEANYAAANVGDTDTNAPNANYCAQTSFEKIGAGVIRYGRQFAQLPVQWYEVEQVVYSYPGASTGTGGTYLRYGARQPITLPKLATVNHFYVLSNNVPSTNVQNVFTLTANISGILQPVNWIGQISGTDSNTTNPSTDPANWIISSDPVRWKGLIWEIVTKSVTSPNTYV